MALALVAAAALATLAVIAFTPVPLAPRILAATWTVCLALEAAHRVALRRGPGGARTLVLRPNGDVRIQDAAGSWRHGTLRDGCFVAPWLTLVLWRPDAARFGRSVLILPSMTHAEDFRRLRVRLRWNRAASAPGAGAVSCCRQSHPEREKNHE